MTLGLVNMFALIPKGNGRWTMFGRAILNIMASNHYPGKPTDLKSQLKEAEEQATLLRTICFHIRREWYRKSSKWWMVHFPRPDCAADFCSPISSRKRSTSPLQDSTTPRSASSREAPRAAMSHDAARLQRLH
jgi:hypothetical protein